MLRRLSKSVVDNNISAYKLGLSGNEFYSVFLWPYSDATNEWAF